MADLMPVNFPIPGEQAIASYDIQDILNGLGYEQFYLCAFTDSSATTYAMIANTIYGDPKIISGTQDTTQTFTFDSSIFNTPRTVKGTLYCDFSLMVDHASGQNAGTGYVVVTLYHYDGSTETSLGTAQTDTVSLGSSGGAREKALKFALTEKTFAVGDRIRVKVQVNSSGGTSGTSVTRVGVDPRNRTYTAVSPGQVSFDTQHTTFNIYVPFKTVI